MIKSFDGFDNIINFIISKERADGKAEPRLAYLFGDWKCSLRVAQSFIRLMKIDGIRVPDNGLYPFPAKVAVQPIPLFVSHGEEEKSMVCQGVYAREDNWC